MNKAQASTLGRAANRQTDMRATTATSVPRVTADKYGRLPLTPCRSTRTRVCADPRPRSALREQEQSTQRGHARYLGAQDQLAEIRCGEARRFGRSQFLRRKSTFGADQKRNR